MGQDPSAEWAHSIRSQHELIFVFKNGDAPHINNFELGQHGRNRSNVWTYAGVNTFRAGRLDDLSVHPTVKPVAMVADAMRDCSRRGDIVLDPFMGSGTTILAAERVGRRGLRPRDRSALRRCRGPTLAELHQARRGPEGDRSDIRRGGRCPPEVTEDRNEDAVRRPRAGFGGAMTTRDQSSAPQDAESATASHRASTSSSRAQRQSEGRPKGSKNESTILREILQRKIAKPIGPTELQKIMVLEGIHLRIAEDSLKGNTKSATFLAQSLRRAGFRRAAAQDLSDDDREVLEAFAKRIERKSQQRSRT